MLWKCSIVLLWRVTGFQANESPAEDRSHGEKSSENYLQLERELRKFIQGIK